MIWARVARAALAAVTFHAAGAPAELPPYRAGVSCATVWAHPKPDYPVWVRFGSHWGQTSLYEARLDRLPYSPVCPT